MPRSRDYAAPLVSLTAVAGALLVLYTTRHGVGVSPDSTVYVGAARSLLAGRGLVALDAAGTLRPLTHYPPLFPAALALCAGAARVDPVEAARGLNALLFGATLLLSGLALRARGAVWLAALCPFLLAFSPDLLRVHTMAWSEPLFIFASLAGLVLLSLRLDGCGRKYLFASAAAFALAMLARYVGVVLVGAGVFAVLAFSRESRARKALDALALTCVACLPLALWLVRNSLAGGDATHRTFDFHPVLLPHLRAALATASGWLVAGKPRAAPWIAVALTEVFAASALLLARLTRPRDAAQGDAARGDAIQGDETRGDTDRDARTLTRLPHVLATFALLYVSFLFVNAVFVEFDSVFDDRALAPAHVALVTLACLLASRLRLGAGAGRAQKLTAALLCALLTGSHLARGSRWARAAARDGQNYASRAWRDSETIARVRSLPAGTHVFTNGQDAVYFLAARSASAVPARVVRGTGRANPDYQSELEAVRARMREEGGVLVYLRGMSERDWFTPAEDELRESLSLRLLAECGDGAIYEAEP